MIIRFWRTVLVGLRDETSRRLFLYVFGFLVMGTVFYTLVEGWSVVDSLYFSVVSLTTVGFGDFSPERTVSKIFTIFYLLTGVSLLVAFGSTVLRLQGDVESIRHRKQRKRKADDESAGM